jgi:hypothetical protein
MDKQTFEACRDSVDTHKARGCFGYELATMKDQRSAFRDSAKLQN